MTTNNLIGYDPLAWMDGADIEEEIPEAPAKKVTKSRAKTKTAPPVEAAEEPVVVPESVEEVQAIEGEIVPEESDEIEVEVTVAEDGEIEISIEANEDSHVSVEVSVNESDLDAESEPEQSTNDAVIDEISEEDTTAEIIEESAEEMPTEKTEEAAMPEETPVEEALAEPHIDLETDATIKNIAALYAKVKDSLAAHDAIEINAADVASIDTATLQLLVSLKKDAPNLGKTVDIIYPSERFIESAKLLGLLEILDVSAV